MNLREYEPTRDTAAAQRLFGEVGWFAESTKEEMNMVLAAGRTLVADINGEVECLVETTPGEMRYLEVELPLAEVALVATSRVARKQGLAQRLLARSLAASAADGAALSRVCIFDQGFYNRAGFGPGGYEHGIHFDPASLRVNVTPRVPRRLTCEDRGLVFAARNARPRGHGGARYRHADMLDMSWARKGFGLGYCDGPNGELTHHFCCAYESANHGPYHVQWIDFQTRDQFLELLALIKSLGDQVRLVRVPEPPGVQLQDMLDRPFRHEELTKSSRYENRITASAYWQVRILDLDRCLAGTHLPWGEVRFNLRLTDPIEKSLGDDAGWRGVAGDYIVTLGPNSSCTRGADPSLPTLEASVNAFSRLWLGVRPATGLALTDDLAGPESLLAALEACLRLPEPRPGWEF